MKPAMMEYYAPTRLDEATTLLAEAAENGGKVIAGGQSLIPMMNFRLVRPPVLIDLGGVAELTSMEATDSHLSLGAMVTTATITSSDLVRRNWPLLAHAATWVGHDQIRNRGTVGGSLVHADPSAEMPAVMLLADAGLEVRSATGSRTVDAADFFWGYMSTALEEDEILVRLTLEIPPPGTRWGFCEFAQRHGDFAEAGAACLLPPGGQPRVVAFGAADRPFRATETESVLLAGPAVDAEKLRRAASEDAAQAEVKDRTKVRLLGTMVQRAIAMARDQQV
ncbi:xanthine dehydrogenase family protein subunit M [Sphaerisporangium flaviroseum]|uniref:Xanthine dehydrogenase family protein subunit M n=1 Tax=Sphaerisporangium flaviroseum TaxID=509199 RepID=A0ABP7HWA0_9ACTN